jgi:hypothetical protein
MRRSTVLSHPLQLALRGKTRHTSICQSVKCTFLWHALVFWVGLECFVGLAKTKSESSLWRAVYPLTPFDQLDSKTLTLLAWMSKSPKIKMLVVF